MRRIGKVTSYYSQMKTSFIVLGSVFLSFATEVNISGTVVDQDSAPLPGATVLIEKSRLIFTTGEDGRFQFDTAPIKRFRDHLPIPGLSAELRNGILYLNLQQESQVEIMTSNLLGQTLFNVQREMAAGAHAIPMVSGADGVYFHRVKSGEDELLIKSRSTGSGQVSMEKSSAAFVTSLARKAADDSPLADFISVTKFGYLAYRMPLSNPDTQGIQITMTAWNETLQDADGNVYKTMKIGNQVWMAENLRTTQYSDSTKIPYIDYNNDSHAIWNNLYSPAYCIYNDTANTRKYGAMYNWYAVEAGKLAPEGWHVPTLADWDTLQNFLMTNGYNWDGTSEDNKIAKSLAAASGWNSSAEDGTIGKDLSLNNRSGFSALPGGIRYEGGFLNIPEQGYWWSDSAYQVNSSYFVRLGFFQESFNRASMVKASGCSVRLVKDSH